jgi:hypothetical protein
MDARKIDLVIQYALAVAGEADDFRDRELGPIHLVKFVYLADLAHAQQESGLTFTETDWRFHHFGPWSVGVFQRIPLAARGIGAEERRFPSKFKDEDAVRWRSRGGGLLGKLEALLPRSVTSSVRRAVQDHGSDTSSLLHHVYSTPPMLKAAPGELLDFRTATEERAPSSEDAALPLPEISKTKADRLKALVKNRLNEKRQTRKLVAPDPPPRYDEVFEKGKEWLDGLAGPSVEPVSGRLYFSERVWKSSARGEPEIP